ncbi:MAG: ATP-binding protein [Candidatus Sericytochromatia bacterium]
MKSSQYVALFVDEASLLLEQCQNCLEQIAAQPHDRALNLELFRLVHTLKGMAATLLDLPHFEDMTQISHCMESLLTPAQSVLPLETLELLGEGVLVLQDLVQQVQHPQRSASPELQPLMQRFLAQPVNMISRPEPYRAPKPMELGAFEITPQLQSYLQELQSQRLNIWEVHIELMPACLMKSVRTLLVLHNLEQQAEVLALQPSLDMLREGAFENRFALLVSSELDAAAIQAIAESVSEIEKVEVKAFQAGGSAAHPVVELNEFELRLIEAAYSQNWHVIWVTTTVHPPVQKPPGVLAQLFRTLENHGEIIRTEPVITELEHQNDLPVFRLLMVSPHSAVALHQELQAPAAWQDHFTLDTEAYQPPKPQAAPVQDTAFEITALHIGSAGGESNSALPAPALPSPFQESERLKNIRLQHLVRVDAEHLKQLNQLTNELLLVRAQLNQPSYNGPALGPALENLNRISAGLQSVSMQLQTITAHQVFNRYPRMVRDLARSLNKEIGCLLTGGKTELDRAYVDDLSSILLHLIRNAADHGLEPASERQRLGKSAQGLITLSAHYAAGNVAIVVHDDGRGIDLSSLRQKAVQTGLLSASEADALSPEETLQLIFRPGLSTSATATDISGRGVGMDVVRTHVMQMGGTLQVESNPGIGTRFTMYLPSELREMQALLVRAEHQVFALPLDGISHICQLSEMTQSERIVSLHSQQEWQAHPATRSPEAILLKMREGEEPTWLLADELIGTQELAVKWLNGGSNHGQAVQGAALLDESHIALYIDPLSLVTGAKVTL